MSALCLLGPRDEPVTGGQWPPDPFRNMAAVSARLDPSAAQPALVKADTNTHSYTLGELCTTGISSIAGQ